MARPLDTPLVARPLDTPLVAHPLDTPLVARPLDTPLVARPLGTPLVARPLDTPLVARTLSTPLVRSQLFPRWGTARCPCLQEDWKKTNMLICSVFSNEIKHDYRDFLKKKLRTYRAVDSRVPDTQRAPHCKKQRLRKTYCSVDTKIFIFENILILNLCI